jgi:hypothetical protein
MTFGPNFYSQEIHVNGPIPIQRREFLAQTGATAGVCGAIACGSSAAAVEPPSPVVLLEAERFERLVGERFLVRGHTPTGEPTTSVLVLTECRRRPLPDGEQRAPHLRQQPFSLLFSAAEGGPLKDGTHRVEHRRLGEVSLFLHPVGGGSRPRYEAVFN